jgi:hypothetical protein
MLSPSHVILSRAKDLGILLSVDCAKHLGIFSYRCETNARILRFAQNDASFASRSDLRRSV